MAYFAFDTRGEPRSRSGLSGSTPAPKRPALPPLTSVSGGALALLWRRGPARFSDPAVGVWCAASNSP
jgi:hypothetical protein